MKRSIIVAAVVLSLLMVSSFAGQAVLAEENDEIDVDLDIEPYAMGVYNFDWEEFGIRGGADFAIDEELSFMADFAYFSLDGDYSFIEIRGSAAFDVAPRLMPEQEETSIKPYAGASIQRLSNDASFTEFDIHLGGVVSQQVTEDVSIRGDAAFSTGTISDFDSAFSLGGGVGFRF